jgi:general L-amino acid transport system permease protein
VEGRRRDVRAASAVISTTQTPAPVAIGSTRFWSSARTRSIIWQIVAVAVVVGIIALVGLQTATNLRARGIASGFDFLGRAAGFEIARGPIEFSSRDTYARALVVGLLNTLRVSLTGIVLATSLGVGLGMARLSNVWIASTAARCYLEVIRNTPLLLQLLFWYALTQELPGPNDALNPLPGVFLCFRGLFFPSLLWHSGFPWISIEQPVLEGFGFRGGASLSPEFAALLVGLTTYTAAFIGEIVRGGVLAVDKGQREAASALGLSRMQVLRLVLLPQALRVVIPPTTAQFLNLTKNSSLAVAIGYPDLISITNTTLNQTGQAIEAIALAMSVYLAISVSLSFAMNTYNAAILARGGRSA